MNFEQWCDLTERDPSDRDLCAAWEDSRTAALEEAKQLCIDREARVGAVDKDDSLWFDGFKQGIKTGAHHCACEINEAMRAKPEGENN